jgi:hypothetical protein
MWPLIYLRDALLVPTLADKPRTPPTASGMTSDTVLKSGSMMKSASTEARHSFVGLLEDGKWQISHHHVSLQPESADCFTPRLITTQLMISLLGGL